MSVPPSRPSSPVRASIEKSSLPLLAKLHAMPRLLVPLGTLVLVAVGAFAPLPVAVVALAAVITFVVWIAYLSWPVVSASGRLLRVAMVILVLGLAVTRF